MANPASESTKAAEFMGIWLCAKNDHPVSDTFYNRTLEQNIC